jgi:Phasin protein
MNPFQAAIFPISDASLVKTWAGFGLPPYKMDVLFEMHRRNAEAVSNANQAVFDGLRRMAQRQGELFASTVNDCNNVARDVLAGASFREKASNQVDAVRHVYISSVAGFRELSDIAIKTNVAVGEILGARLHRSFDELGVLFGKAPAPAAAIGLAAVSVDGEAAAVIEETAEPEHADSAAPKTRASKSGRTAKPPSRRRTARG